MRWCYNPGTPTQENFMLLEGRYCDGVGWASWSTFVQQHSIHFNNIFRDACPQARISDVGTA
jgi:hypothetical protein